MKITFLEGQYELARRTIESDEEYLQLSGLSDRLVSFEKDHHISADTGGRDQSLIGQLMVDRELFQDYRAHALRRTIRRVYENSSFYRNKLEAAGITPDDIRDFSDIAKLPFTFPDDLRGKSYDFLCMSERYVERPVSFYSSGTTGIRKRMFFSFRDTERIKAFIGVAMNSIADTEDTRILSLMTNSNGRGASSVYVAAVQARGIEAWIGNMEDGADEILRVSREHDCNVWFGDIGTIYRTAKELESSGVELASLSLKLLYVTMGNISGPVRRYLEDAFQCEVITHYGLTEVGWGFAIEQPELGGYYSNELDVYTEVIDPDTGEIMPDGVPGELTFTIIGKEAMPLIRYRSGDIAWIRRAEGEGQLDLIGFIERRLEGVKTSPSGQVITPAMIEETLYSFPEVIDYRLYDHGDHIGIGIEVVGTNNTSDAGSGGCSEAQCGSVSGGRPVTQGTPGRSDECFSDFAARLGEALHELPGVRELGPCEVEILPRGALKEFCYEKKRFILADHT